MTTTPVPSPVPSPVPGPGPAGADVEALQVTLAAEHAACYVYGVLGGRTSESAQPDLFALVRDAYVEHRDRRDAVIGLVATAGEQPAGAAAAYVVPPGDLTTPEGVTAVAAAIEAGCAATYAAQVGNTRGEVRRLGIDWLRAAALRELVVRGTPEMFPGADEQPGG